MSKANKVVGDFESEYGKFKPGDKAYAVTTGTGHTVKVELVEYVGYITRESYNWRTKENTLDAFAQIRRPIRKTQWYNKDTGVNCKWFPGAAVRWIDTTTITTLKLNRLIPIVQ